MQFDLAVVDRDGCVVDPVGTGLAGLVAGMRGRPDGPGRRPSADSPWVDSVAVLAQADQLLGRAHALRAAAVAAVTEDLPVFGSRDGVIGQLMVGLGISQRAADALLGDSLALRAHPLVWQALYEGDVDVGRARVLAEKLDVLPLLDADSVPRPEYGAEYDRLLSSGLAFARDHTAPQLRRFLDRLLAGIDPAFLAGRRRRGVRELGVWLSHHGDGTAELTARLAAEDAASVYAAIRATAIAGARADREAGATGVAEAGWNDTPAEIEACARDHDPADADTAAGPIVPGSPAWFRMRCRGHGAGPDGSGPDGSGPDGADARAPAPVVVLPAAPDDPFAGVTEATDHIDQQAFVGEAAAAVPFGRRLAEALHDLILPPNGRGPVAVTTQVQVTIPATSLAGLSAEPGVLPGGGLVPADVARRLAASDARWRAVLTDPVTGTVLDVGNTTYRPPVAMARLVRIRDGCCRFPGCLVGAPECDLDHLIPFPAGPTAASNLHSLCRRHHRLKHEGGWSVEAVPDGRLRWTSPLGTVAHSDPAITPGTSISAA